MGNICLNSGKPLQEDEFRRNPTADEAVVTLPVSENRPAAASVDDSRIDIDAIMEESVKYEHVFKFPDRLILRDAPEIITISCSRWLQNVVELCYQTDLSKPSELPEELKGFEKSRSIVEKVSAISKDKREPALRDWLAPKSHHDGSTKDNIQRRLQFEMLIPSLLERIYEYCVLLEVMDVSNPGMQNFLDEEIFGSQLRSLVPLINTILPFYEDSDVPNFQSFALTVTQKLKDITLAKTVDIGMVFQQASNILFVAKEKETDETILFEKEPLYENLIKNQKYHMDENRLIVPILGKKRDKVLAIINFETKRDEMSKENLKFKECDKYFIEWFLNHEDNKIQISDDSERRPSASNMDQHSSPSAFSRRSVVINSKQPGKNTSLSSQMMIIDESEDDQSQTESISPTSRVMDSGVVSECSTHSMRVTAKERLRNADLIM